MATLVGSEWPGINSGVETGDEVEANLTASFAKVDADIVNLDNRVTDLESTGLVVMSGNSLTPQTIAITPTKVVLFGTKDVEAGVGAIGDITLHRAIASLGGVFKLRFEAFVSYASNVDITWRIYKNGAPFGNSITLAGQGTKVFPITLLTSTTFIANDYIELYATASASTDITISQVNGTLEKTHF